MKWLPDKELEDNWLCCDLGWNKRQDKDELAKVVANRESYRVAAIHVPAKYKNDTGTRCIIFILCDLMIYSFRRYQP